MKNSRWGMAWAAALLACPASAGFPPLDPSVWALKEEPAKGIMGAVILERRISLQNTCIEHVYRVRILSEAGRPAAEFPPFPESSHSFEGRTVYRDGRQVVFSQKRDFLAKRAYSWGDREAWHTRMITPGISSDCVVELRWQESADSVHQSPLPKESPYFWEFPVAPAFFTMKMQVEVPRNFPYAFYVLPGRNLVPEMVQKGTLRVFTLTGVPAAESAPFLLEATRDRPRFLAYQQPDPLKGASRTGGDAYWKAAMQCCFQPYFSSELRKGKAFQPGFCSSNLQEIETANFANKHE